MTSGTVPDEHRSPAANLLPLHNENPSDAQFGVAPPTQTEPLLPEFFNLQRK